MSRTFNLLSVRDLFAKLRRDADALDQEVTSDRLFNFVITGYSLIDWVKNDPNNPHKEEDPVIKRLRTDKWLKICGELANSCKHFALEEPNRRKQRRKPITVSALSKQGFGLGRYGRGWVPKGTGEESTAIQLRRWHSP